jgi:hypothetical protein
MYTLKPNHLILTTYYEWQKLASTTNIEYLLIRYTLNFSLVGGV